MAEADIAVVVSPALASAYLGPSSGFGVRLKMAVRQPTPERLNALVNAPGAAAADERVMALAQVAVDYVAADCAELERQARELAIANARRAAEQQARLLGTTLGDLVVASDAAPSGHPGAGAGWTACNEPAGTAARPPYDPGASTVPGFNPTDPAEARSIVTVSLTYALPES